MSQLEVDKIIPQSGTTLTIGDSGDTITFGTGTTPQLGGNLDTNGNDINFGDNDKAQFGASNDLQIYHDGSRSIIQDNGTGNLRIQAENLELNNADNSENYIFCGHNGAVKLYYDNAEKLATTSTGVDVRTAISGAESKLRVSSDNTGDNDATVVISNGGTGDAMLRFDYEESNTDRARIGITSSGQHLQFFTAGNNERMRIDSSGNVGIGTTDTTGQKFIVEDDLADYMTRFVNQGNNANRFGILIQAGADDGSGNTRYLTATDGDGNATGALETSSGTFQLVDISDERLKQDIIDTSINGLDAISNMRIVDFSYKKNPSYTVIGGFIAQELQQIFPQAVSNDNTEENILSVSRERLVPVLVKAIQEQQTTIEQLEARITALET